MPTGKLLLLHRRDDIKRYQNSSKIPKADDLDTIKKFQLEYQLEKQKTPTNVPKQFRFGVHISWTIISFVHVIKKVSSFPKVLHNGILL